MPRLHHFPHLVFRAAALLVAACGFGAADGRSFPIDPADGRDDADGFTPATAWKTARALRKRALQPGDQALFKAGTRHGGTIDLTGGGVRGRRVEIGRYGDGPAPVLDGAGGFAALTLTNPDFLELRDLEITNPGAGRTARNGLVIVANDGTAAEQLWLHHLHVHHVAGHDDRNGGAGLLLGAGRSATGRAAHYAGVVIEHCRLHDVEFENNAFIFQQAGERRFIRAGNWLDPGWPEDIAFRRNLIVTAGSLYHESGSATGIRFQGNQESGDVRFGSANDKWRPPHTELPGSWVESFHDTVRTNPAI